MKPRSPVDFFSWGRCPLLADLIMGRLRLVMVPDRIKDAVPEGFREKRAAQFVGVGIHLFRRLVRDGRIVPRLLGKTRIYLRADLEGFLLRLPVDHSARVTAGRKVHQPIDRDARLPTEQRKQLPVDRKGSLPVDGRALKISSQDPARLHRKEDTLGH